MKPELYHAHHLSYTEDLPYWISLADQARGPILELGCGTGRIMQFLRREGFYVFGLDHNLHMLRYLKQQDSSAPVFLADLTQFQLGIQFSLVILTCNTYSTLSPVDRIAALNCVSRHLEEGGLFAASLPNPQDLVAMENSDEAGVEETFKHPNTGNPVQVSSSWQTSDERVTIYWHYDHLLPDGQVRRTTHSTSHCLDSAETYIKEMEAKGFSVQTDGEYNHAPYTKDTNFLLLRGYKSV